jgi:hypothetical protein
MRRLRCVKPFGFARLGDEVEVPDGAAVDPEHWEDVPAPAPLPAAVTAPAFPPIPVKEGM